MAEFDVADSRQVAGASQLDVDLGIGGRRLIVASGICCTSWEVDADQVRRRLDVVHLRIPADRVETATVHVALASIANDDTSFGFAVDKALVTVNSAGELDMSVEVAVMGETSSLNRISYQVVATIVREFPEISGVIRWHSSLFTPASRHPYALAGHLTVELSEQVAPAAGGFGGGAISFRSLALGEITAVSLTGETYAASYRIPNPPKGRHARVRVFPVGFAGAAGGDIIAVSDVADAESFTLSIDEPSRAGLDFTVREHVLR